MKLDANSEEKTLLMLLFDHLTRVEFLLLGHVTRSDCLFGKAPRKITCRFVNPSGARLVPFQGLLAVLSGGREGQHDDDGRRCGRFITIQACGILFLCAFSPCPLDPEESHPC